MPIPTSAQKLLSVIVLLLAAAPTLAKESPSRKKEAPPPHVTEIGGASVSLPVLPGFSPAPTEQFAVVEQRIGKGNRLLSYQLPGDAVDPEGARLNAAQGRSFVIQTNPKNERQTMSDADFQALKADVRKQFALLEAAAGPGRPAANAEKELPALQDGKPSPLMLFAGTDRSLAMMVAVKQTMDVNGRKETVPQAISLAVVLLKGKVISLSVYSKLQSPADVQWVEKQTRAWIKQALAANR